MIWQQFKNQNSIRSIDPEFTDCFFVTFNKIKVQEVIDYLNTHNIKTTKEAWKYIDTLTDSFECCKCKWNIPCSVKEYSRGSWNRKCDTCIEEQDKKYKEERNNLIGKQIVKVDYGNGLKIYLNDNTIIRIRDSEYDDDCSEIIKGG